MPTIDHLMPELLLQIFGHLEYRDIVSVGKTRQQWHDLSQDEQLLQKIESRDFTPETWPHRNDTLVPYLCVSSTGSTFNRVLGLYALQTGTRHGGKPVYEQMGGKLKICYDSMNNVWTVARTDGNNFKLLRAKTTTTNPTTAAWEDAYSHDDVPLTIAAKVQLPPACSVIISCGCQSQCKFHPEVLGEYAATALYVLGRVVYKHVDQELYLAVDGCYGCYWRWTVRRKDVGGRWSLELISSNNTVPKLCPAEEAWYNKHLVVKCLIH